MKKEAAIILIGIVCLFLLFLVIQGRTWIDHDVICEDRINCAYSVKSYLFWFDWFDIGIQETQFSYGVEKGEIDFVKLAHSNVLERYRPMLEEALKHRCE